MALRSMYQLYLRRSFSSQINEAPMGPAARHHLLKNNILFEKVKGSGKKGRIFKHDVLAFINGDGTKSQDQAKTQEKTKVLFESKPPSYTAVPPHSNTKYEDIPNSNIRKVIAKRLTESKSTVPHVYVTTTVNFDEIMEMRSSLNAQQIKLSVNDFVIRASALALKDVPQVNASWEKGELKYHDAADISVAVASEKGLITPIVKGADKRGLQSISQTVKELAAKANDGKLQPHEFQGGSFSISNLGMFGIDEFSAVINPPQVAILAVGAGKKEVSIDTNTNKPSVKTVVKLTLSYDQRAVEARDAAKFMKSLKIYLENPHFLSGSSNTKPTEMELD